MSDLKGYKSIINKHFDQNKIRQTSGIIFTTSSSTCDSDPPQAETDEKVAPLESQGDAAAGPSPIGDKSRKGNLDHRIENLIKIINLAQNFYTSSSCSGRAILLNNRQQNQESTSGSNAMMVKKKGCEWIYVNHDEIQLDEVIQIWTNLKSSDQISEVVFKVEPAIFHIQCRSLYDAKQLIHVGTEAGFKNSGLVLGKDGKITVALRSTLSMEIPLKIPENHESPIGQQFVNYLWPYWITVANEKLKENWNRIQKLEKNISKILS